MEEQKNSEDVFEDTTRVEENSSEPIEMEEVLEQPDLPKEKKALSKKKKVIIIISVIVAVLAVVAIAVAVIFFMQKEESIEAFQSAVENSWASQTEAEGKPEFMKLLESKSTFSVANFAENDEEHYTLEITVSSPDILPAMQNLNKMMKKELSQKEIDTLLTKAVKDARPKTSTVNLNVTKTQNNYRVEFSEEFIDAMYGYAYSYANSQLNEATNIK